MYYGYGIGDFVASLRENQIDVALLKEARENSEGFISLDDLLSEFKGEAEGHPFRGNQYGSGSGKRLEKHGDYLIEEYQHPLEPNKTLFRGREGDAESSAIVTGAHETRQSLVNHLDSLMASKKPSSETQAALDRAKKRAADWAKQHPESAKRSEAFFNQ